VTIAPSESSTNASDLLTLACWMAGDFSNYKQSFANPQLYAHIHIYFRPLPIEFFSAIGFYSEQAYDHDLWTPYRQGVHKLVDCGDRIYIENYSLKDQCYNCSMVFMREGEMFRGSVEPGNQCLIKRNGCQTYLVSEVELTERTWISLDKGMDIETHKQIWGSTAGPLQFEKRESFADELCAVSALC
jgi:CpeT protein